MTWPDRKRLRIDTKCLPIEPFAELRGRAVFCIDLALIRTEVHWQGDGIANHAIRHDVTLSAARDIGRDQGSCFKAPPDLDPTSRRKVAGGIEFLCQGGKQVILPEILVRRGRFQRRCGSLHVWRNAPYMPLCGNDRRVGPQHAVKLPRILERIRIQKMQQVEEVF